ncbi:hypothetical protein D3C78_1702230 [compost metagenome]
MPLLPGNFIGTVLVHAAKSANILPVHLLIIAPAHRRQFLTHPLTGIWRHSITGFIQRSIERFIFRIEISNQFFSLRFLVCIFDVRK